MRGEQYRLLRGLFYGAGDDPGEDERAPRLYSVTLEAGASAVGRELATLDLEILKVQLRAVRRAPGGVKSGPLQSGDVLVLLGTPEALAAAEDRLLRG